MNDVYLLLVGLFGFAVVRLAVGGLSGERTKRIHASACVDVSTR